MPALHLKTLSYLISHLGKVSEAHEENSMSVSNLAIVFGPTLLRPPAAHELTMDFNDIPFQKEAVQFVITNRADLFENEEDTEC